jgi:hypothetical protein
VEYDDVDQIIDDYQDAVINLFANSPEGQAYTENNSGSGFWIAQLINYGYYYEGFTLPKMTTKDVQMVVEQLFPRKISLSEPEDADKAIPELIAFWQFLKREYKFKNADSILSYLESIKSKYRGIINDSSKFGIAKSFFAMGQKSGFDMTDPKQMEAFQLAYNASLSSNSKENNQNMLSGFGGFEGPMFDTSDNNDGSSNKILKAKRKKTRDLAKQSRKRNRTNRK